MTESYRDALEHVLDAFRERFKDDGGEVLDILDEHEARLATDAGNRASYIIAAALWREQVLERFERIEARLDKLEAP